MNDSKVKIVVGLGNYGDKYAYNFHNMGFLAIDCLCDRYNVKLSNRECNSLTTTFQKNGVKVVFAKPLTFMNLSGQAVKGLIKRYNAQISDVIVIFDDIDLPSANVRVRQSGSGGTHNGMRNIIAEIQSTDFPRVRIGIGRPPERVPLADYVLSDVPKDMRPALADAIERACDEVEKMVFC